MNKAIISGTAVRDAELKTTSSDVAVASFCLAVQRKFKDANGEKQTDFLNINCWRALAEFAGKYVRKGDKYIVVGSIQNRSWDDKDGHKRTVTEIIADEIDFAGSKGTHTETSNPAPKADDGFFPGGDENTALPFDI